MQQGHLDLDTALSAIDLLDAEQVEWQRVRRCVYLIHQHLHYAYPGPIYDLQQRLIIQPPACYGDQRLLDQRLNVSCVPSQTIYQDDAFGNTQINIFVPEVEQAVDFEAWMLVERQVQRGPHYCPASCLKDGRFLEPSALTQPDELLRTSARSLQREGVQGLQLAQRINDWVYQTMNYAHDITDIHTPASEALALEQGVCQDYAHVMIALCRLCGIAARYVSGHLLGEGGTHAWVEVLLPVPERPEVALVAPFDPTHGRSASISYITVAVGRDYYDVAPTSGSFRASYRGQLSAKKRVNLTLYEYGTMPL